MLAPSFSALGVAALLYARFGWRVFRIAPGSKQPLKGSRGYLDATTDVDTIVRWWTDTPNANVGIACGSGVVVLDEDPRNGGTDTREELERLHGRLPDTVTCLTQGGGTHRYYLGGARKGIVGPGLELQGAGAYVVAPPSVGPSGGRYAWEASSEPGELPMSEAPPWLLERAAPVEAPEGARDATWSLVGAAFAAANMLGKRLADGRRAAICPWRHEHSGGKDYDTSTVVFPAREGSTYGWFRCLHAHCHGRGAPQALAMLPAEAVAAAEQRYPAPVRAPRASLHEVQSLPTADNPLDLWTASDMTGDPPAPNYLVRRIHLAPGRPFALTAYAGAGKTFLLADLALAVAGGGQCWGTCEVQRSGPVVHLDLELGKASTWRRYKRLAAGRGYDVASLGDALRWRSYPAFRLTSPGAYDLLCRALHGAALAILDSLKALCPGVDENDSRIADYMEILARISEATGCAVALIHHEGKPPAEGAKDARYRARGSSAIQGWLGSQWSVSRATDCWLLEHGKSEHGKEQAEIRLQLVDIGDPDEDGITPAVRFRGVAAPERGAEGLAELTAIAGRIVAVLRRQNLKSVEIVAKAAKMKKPTAALGLRHLTDLGWVIKNPLGWYQLLGPAEVPPRSRAPENADLAEEIPQ